MDGRFVTFAAAVALLLVAPAGRTQGGNAAAAGSTVALPAARVARALENLAGRQNLSGRLIDRNATPSGMTIVIAAGGKKKKGVPPDETVFVFRDGILCWTRAEGQGVLATKAGRWVRKDRDGAWIPCTGPCGPWFDGVLPPRPRFLARELAALASEAEWSFEGGDTLDDRPVRVYRGRLKKSAAKRILRTGALPAKGAGLPFRFIVALGANGRLVPPEPDIDLDVVVYVDPAHRVPVRITFEYRSETRQAAQGVVQVLGVPPPQKQNKSNDKDDEEEEEAEDDEAPDRPKPYRTVEFRFDPKPKELDPILPATARKLLEPGAAAGGQR